MIPSDFVPLVVWSPDDVRRDFGALLARSALAPGERWSCGELAVGEPFDLASAFDPPERWAGVRARLESIAAPTRTAIVIPRSIAESVLADPSTTPGDVVRSLEHLTSGGVARAPDAVAISIDDARNPCLGWVGSAPEALELARRVARAASHDLPVVIQGETGTGKEIVARAIQRFGRAPHRPWVALNCATLPPDLVESELFGHARGSFTGSIEDRAGIFEAAADGTVFLDEVGELAPSAQAKLLRVLESRRVRRIGSAAEKMLRCRIVAATNRDLATEAREGRFRADLFYRLRGASISLRPLRKNPRSIIPLAETFATRAALRLGRPPVELAHDARIALGAHDWPGNVRELRQTIEVTVAEIDGSLIRARDLGLTPVSQSRPDDDAPIVTVAALERAHIVRALETTSGNKVVAARLLGLTRQSLDRRLRRHGISLPARNGAVCPHPGSTTGRDSDREIASSRRAG